MYSDIREGELLHIPVTDLGFSFSLSKCGSRFTEIPALCKLPGTLSNNIDDMGRDQFLEVPMLSCPRTITFLLKEPICKTVDGYLELSSPGQLQPLPLGDGNEGKWLPKGLLAHLNKA